MAAVTKGKSLYSIVGNAPNIFFYLLCHGVKFFNLRFLRLKDNNLDFPVEELHYVIIVLSVT
jgi:hypothetical protein